MREKTRRNRYLERHKVARILPISIATINFRYEVNVAHVIRAAACFGVEEVCIIGTYPSRSKMNALSGSMFDYVKIRTFSTTNEFLEYTKSRDMKLVSIELPSSNFVSYPIDEYKFKFSQHLCLIVGHESIGVPVDILLNSDIIYIPMIGVGSCLNTAQAANIALYKTTSQYVNHA